MKTTLFISSIALFLLFSCASTEHQHSQKNSESIATEVKKPAPLPPSFFEVKCDETTLILREKTFSTPLFVIVTQEHCPPCEILYKRVRKLKQRFGERVDFVVIYNDNQIHSVENLDVCRLTKDTDHLVTPTQQFPRTVIFDDRGEVAADLTGVYPQMYYYRILREILTNQRLRSLSEQSPQE